LLCARPAQTQIKQQFAERRQLEFELHRQTEQASTAAQQAETAQRRIQELCRCLEQDLADQRQAREALAVRLAQQEQIVAGKEKRLQNLQIGLDRAATKLDHTQAELQK
jgi:hypothetical protein